MLLVLLLAHFLSAEQTEAWGPHSHNPHSHNPHDHNPTSHDGHEDRPSNRPDGINQKSCGPLGWRSCPADYKQEDRSEGGWKFTCWGRKHCYDTRIYFGERCGAPASQNARQASRTCYKSKCLCEPTGVPKVTPTECGLYGRICS